MTKLSSKDMIERCEAFKETSRQKGSDDVSQLDKKQLMNKIRNLEAENYTLKKKLEDAMKCSSAFNPYDD